MNNKTKLILLAFAVFITAWVTKPGMENFKDYSSVDVPRSDEEQRLIVRGVKIHERAYRKKTDFLAFCTYEVRWVTYYKWEYGELTVKYGNRKYAAFLGNFMEI